MRYIQLYPTISDYIPSYPIISHHNIPPYPTTSKPGYPEDIRPRGAYLVPSLTLLARAAAPARHIARLSVPVRVGRVPCFTCADALEKPVPDARTSRRGSRVA